MHSIFLGQQDKDKVRALSYPGTDVAVMTFSLADPTTLASVGKKWWPEIRQHLPTVPLILLGLKSDLKGQASRG